jgi:hypothetical protein
MAADTRFAPTLQADRRRALFSVDFKATALHTKDVSADGREFLTVLKSREKQPAQNLTVITDRQARSRNSGVRRALRPSLQRTRSDPPGAPLAGMHPAPCPATVVANANFYVIRAHPERQLPRHAVAGPRTAATGQVSVVAATIPAVVSVNVQS